MKKKSSGQTAGKSALKSAAKTPVWKVSPSAGNYINSVDVTPDGAKVVGGTFYYKYSATQSRHKSGQVAVPAVVATETGTFGTYCYNKSGALLWKNEFAGWQGVYWVAISANGARAAAGGWFSDAPKAGFVRGFDATNGRLLLDYRTTTRVNQVVLSGDGTWLVSAAETLVLFRYDPGTGGYVKADEFTPTISPNSTTSSGGVVGVGISTDGSTVVFADYAGHIGVFANAAGKLTLRRQWQVPSSFSHMVRLTPDGKSFAAGGAAGAFYLCDTAQFVADGKPTLTYNTGVAGAVYGVAVQDDGSLFVGVVNNGADAGWVYIVARVGNTPVLQAKFATARNPNSASLNLAGHLLAVADGHPDGTPGNFYLFDNVVKGGLPLNTAGLRWQYTTGNMSWPIAISTNGAAVVAGSDDSYIYYFTP